MNDYILFVRDLLFKETTIHYSAADMKILEVLLSGNSQIDENIRGYWASLQSETISEREESYASDIAPSIAYSRSSYEEVLVKQQIKFLARVLPFCDSNGCVKLSAPYTLLTGQSPISQLMYSGIVTIGDFFNKFPSALHLVASSSVALSRAYAVSMNAATLGLGSHFPMIPRSLSKQFGSEGTYSHYSNHKLYMVLFYMGSGMSKRLIANDYSAVKTFLDICEQTDSCGCYDPDTSLFNVHAFCRHIPALRGMNITTIKDFMSADLSAVPNASLRNLQMRFRRLA